MATFSALVFVLAIVLFFRLRARLKQDAVPEMPDPVTVANIDQALRHISQTYGIEEHHDAHDEADGPAPLLVPAAKKKRGRPRKPKPETPASPKPRPAKAPTHVQSVLATGLRIPATIIYDGGHHAGIPRDVIILQAIGYRGPAGEPDVQCLRCICDKVKQFRAFRIDHIRELTDRETGEIVTDVAAWIVYRMADLV